MNMVAYRLLGIILVSVASAIASANESENRVLKGAFVMFRHGNRAPGTTYPNDPYKDFKWTSGLGFLTETGIRQTYDCGVKFRRRYEQLFQNHEVFENSFIKVQSSGTPRCLMSAQSFMAGLMPPPAEWVLPIAWQPVLIESTPQLEDSMISQLRGCAKYQSIAKERYSVNNPEVINFMGSNYHLLSYINEHVGMTVRGIDDIYVIADVLYLQEKNGLKMPEWAVKIYNDTLFPLTILSSKFTYSSKLSKIRAGSLLKEIVSYLKTFNEPRAPTQKLSIISGHDVTIYSLAYLLNIESQLPVLINFASSIAIEIYETPALKDEHEIKFQFFKNHADENPIALNITGCDEPCTISKFIEATQAKVVEDYDLICNNKGDNMIK